MFFFSSVDRAPGHDLFILAVSLNTVGTKFPTSNKISIVLLTLFVLFIKTVSVNSNLK